MYLIFGPCRRYKVMVMVATVVLLYAYYFVTYSRTACNYKGKNKYMYNLCIIYNIKNIIKYLNLFLLQLYNFYRYLCIIEVTLLYSCNFQIGLQYTIDTIPYWISLTLTAQSACRIWIILLSVVHLANVNFYICC